MVRKSQRAPTLDDSTRRMRRMYRRFAPFYDTVTLLLSLRRWHSWQERVLPHARGRVLDLGCGTGVLLRRLSDRGDAVGLDLSLEMLARASGRQEGDIIRDEVGALRQLGLDPRRVDFGPFGTVHLIAVRKPR